MDKHSFYFSHDYHARHDPKIENILFDVGLSGIGAYWCIVEMLYENGGHLDKRYDRIAMALRSDEQTIKRVVEDYGLFLIEEKQFTSLSVQRRLQERFARVESARINANKRWLKDI